MSELTGYVPGEYNNERVYAQKVARYGLTKMPPVIVSCAITGGLHGAECNPALPETKEAQVQAAYDAYNAGASIVHIHARDPKNLSLMTADVEDFKEVNARIREKCPDLIINNTCIGGRNIDEKTWTVGPNAMVSLDALPEVSSIDLACGSTNMLMKARPAELGGGREKDMVLHSNYMMTMSDAEMVTKEMTRRGIKPELELFNIHNLYYVESMIAQGLLEGPHWIQVLFGGNGIFPTPGIMEELTRLLPPDALLSVIGIGACQTAMITQAMLLGHHVRVGLEDNYFYGPGQLADSNAQLVERAVRIANELGRRVATPAQAREMLGLGAPRAYSF